MTDLGHRLGLQFGLTLFCAWIFSGGIRAAEPIHILKDYKRDDFLLTFSPDGKTLLVGNGEAKRNLELWDVATGKCLVTLNNRDGDNRIGGSAFTPDGKHIVGCTSQHIYLWDAATYKEINKIPVREGAYSRFVLSPDGKTGAVALRKMTAVLYDIKTGKEVGEIVGDGTVNTMAYSPDGKWLVVNSKNRIVIWDVATRKELKFFFSDKLSVEKLLFAADGKSLLSSDSDQIIVWDPQDRSRKAVIATVRKLVEYPLDFTLSPDGNTLALVGEDDRIVLWDLTKQAVRADVEVGKHGTRRVTAVAFSPDGKLLATAGGQRNATVKIWKFPQSK